MNLTLKAYKSMPVEDRIDQLSRLALVMLLLTTLGCIV